MSGAPVNGTPIVALEAVDFAYPGRPPLFRDLHFSLRGGEHVGLRGPNGSGKTTLLRLIVGLETPERGGLFHRGRRVDCAAALRDLRRSVGVVLQNSDEQLFSATVLEDVAFGPLNLGLTRREARDRAMEALAGMGLEKLADRAPQRLSAGEKKMAAIAGVLAMRPEALLLDEPTASLDAEAKARVEAVLASQTIARLVVSHDAGFLARTARTCVRVGESGRVEPAPPERAIPPPPPPSL